jgi:hypothetical protein
MLYEMVTGRLPFEGQTVMALLSKHLTDAAVPPHERRPELRIARPLSDLVMSCLAKAPVQRPTSMDELEERLRSCASPAYSTPVRSSRAGSEPAYAPPVGPLPGGPAPVHTPPAGPMATGPTSAAPAPGSSPVPVSSPPPGVPMSQATPMPPSGGPYPSPPPGPPPATHSPPRRRSRASLWALLSLILLAGAGAGAYVYLGQRNGDDSRGAASEGRSSSGDGFDMAEWESSGQVQDDFSDDDEARDDDDDEPEPDDLGAYDAAVNYSDSAFGYQVHLPAGFFGNGDGMGNANFVGTVNDAQQTVITAAWSEPGALNEDDIEALVGVRLSALNIEVVRSSWRQVNGRRSLVGRFRPIGGDQQGEFVLTRRGPVYFFAAVGGSTASFAETAEFRRRFFQSGFVVPTL